MNHMGYVLNDYFNRTQPSMQNIFIDLTVQMSCFVTIYIFIWANTQLKLILVFRYLWYAIFKV